MAKSKCMVCGRPHARHDYPVRIERMWCPRCGVLRPYLLFGDMQTDDIAMRQRICGDAKACEQRTFEAIVELRKLRRRSPVVKGYNLLQAKLNEIIDDERANHNK